jgi:predicted CXXCH cytochrome family protein
MVMGGKNGGRWKGMGVRWMGLSMGILILFVLNLPMAGASWMIDPARFHASVHGQTSCRECHENVSEQDLHPDPRRVTRSARELFRADRCLGCHDFIMDDLEGGTHGKLKIKVLDQYKDCLGCHDPHYQARIAASEARAYDPQKPVLNQCGACHEVRQDLPPVSAEDAACMTCHRPMAADSPEEIERINAVCLHCHGRGETRVQAITGEFVPLIDEASHESTPHAAVACTTCHRDAASYTHDAQQPQDCGQCHLPHHEKTSGSAHMSVSCQSCHLKGARAVRDAESNCILWERERTPDGRSIVHEMVRFDTDAACQRCHFAGNLLGAASMALPAKSVICMPCHAATFSVGDTITMVSLAIFVVGFILFFSLYLSGSLPGTGGGNPVGRLFSLLGGAVRCIFSERICSIVRSVFWDVLLQRRLYRVSPGRWMIHALIFYGFAVRFVWGLSALFGSLWKPEWPVVWHLVNKDYPVTGLMYDLTGAMILAGVGLAFARGWINRKGRAPGLPEQDRPALGLIGAIVIVGFVLEGMRISMTGYPPGSAYSFIGYGIGLLFSSPRGLVEVYGFVWYIHAALTGAFIAYIPFSRLLHIIIAPVVLAMNACKERD